MTAALWERVEPLLPAESPKPKRGRPSCADRRRVLASSSDRMQTRRILVVEMRDSKAMKVTLLLPTLNEIQGVRTIMPQIKKEWYDQLIVVDGGSTDGTVEYLREQGYFVHCQQNRGLRRAYTEVLPYVEGDVLITFSPDGNSVSSLIPAMIEKMRSGYDLVIASRYLDGAKSYDDNPLSFLGNKAFTVLINFLFRARYTDALVIFRAYKTELIRSLELDQESGYRLPETVCRFTMSWEALLSIRASKRKLRVAEIPGDEPPRIGGGLMLHWRWGIGLLVQVVREVFVWR
jgi:glycosyltransferase involved in cell wall biosynthesis